MPFSAHPGLWAGITVRDEPALQFTFDRTYKVIPSGSLLGLVFDGTTSPRHKVYDYINDGAMAWIGINLISVHFG